VSGELGLGTPWTRALFPSELRAEVEALIPTGYRINVSAVNGRPGPWRISAWRGRERVTAIEERVVYSATEAVVLMAARLTEYVGARVESWTLGPDLTVTTRLDYTEDEPDIEGQPEFNGAFG
jgi:hypothetical protein